MEVFVKLLYLVFCLLQIISHRGLSLCDILVYNQDPPRMIEEEFRDMPSKFGDSLPLEGLRGFVVLAQPGDACTALKAPPQEDNFTGKWVALVARYNCSFEIKVRNAQNAGFNAVIVHNVNSSDLETMSAKNAAGITIPSVFVSEETGFIIENNYLYTERYFVVINGELPFNINTNLLLPFAVVVGLCLVIMVGFMIVKCIKDRRRAHRHRLPYNSLKKIPTCKYAKGDPYDTCAICLDDYLEGDKLRVLPCAHAYHCKCIDPWLTKNRRVCPVCKRRVFAAGESRRRDRRADAEEGGHSSSDADDDRTPLVYPAGNVTQGGTFQEQRENPFLRAARNVNLGRFFRAAALSAEDNERPENDESQNAENAHEGVSPNNESPPHEDDTTNEGQRRTNALTCGRQRGRGNKLPTVQSGAGGSCPEQANERRVNTSPADPFLTGVLNMRGDHFAMKRDDDEFTPTAPDTTAITQPSSSSSRDPKTRTKKHSRIKKTKAMRHRAASETDVPSESTGRVNESFIVNPDDHSINTANVGDCDDANRSIGVAAIPNTQFVQPGQSAPGNALRNFWNPSQKRDPRM